jgi:hypothetical protein
VRRVITCCGPSWYPELTNIKAKEIGYGKPCYNPSKYIRHTQFAGSHSYCAKHGPMERDFMQDDPCTNWETLETE